MSEKETLFLSSDIHGHASLFRAALTEAGYDPANPSHHVVILGDLFDRGGENRAVLRYVESLPRVTVVRGNHEDLLAGVLASGRIDRNAISNGTLETVAEFFGGENIDASGAIRMAEVPRDRLLSYLARTVDYFETAHYRFVHGWQAVIADADGTPTVAEPDSVTRSDWEAARWLGWHRALSMALLPKDGKILVCGHRPAAYGCRFDMSRAGSDSRPYFGNGVIAIDALTVVSGRVNVFVLEDEVREPRTHPVSLREDEFDRVVIGEKTVILFPERELASPITVGDRLALTTRSGRSLTVSVTGSYHYPDVATLWEDFSPTSLGFDAFTYEFPLNAPLYRRFRDPAGIRALTVSR